MRDTAAPAGMYRCYAAETTACHENGEEDVMLHARDAHEDLSKQIAPLEWKVAGDNTEQMTGEVAGDNATCPCAVESLLLWPLAKRIGYKNTSSMRNGQTTSTPNKDKTAYLRYRCSPRFVNRMGSHECLRNYTPCLRCPRLGLRTT